MSILALGVLALISLKTEEKIIKISNEAKHETKITMHF